jgi:hypothetical protein
MSAVYGHEISARNDPLIPVVEIAQDLGLAVLTPEGSMILKNLPFCEFNILMRTN